MEMPEHVPALIIKISRVDKSLQKSLRRLLAKSIVPYDTPEESEANMTHFLYEKAQVLTALSEYIALNASEPGECRLVVKRILALTQEIEESGLTMMLADNGRRHSYYMTTKNKKQNKQQTKQPRQLVSVPVAELPEPEQVQVAQMANFLKRDIDKEEALQGIIETSEDMGVYATPEPTPEPPKTLPKRNNKWTKGRTIDYPHSASTP